MSEPLSPAKLAARVSWIAPLAAVFAGFLSTGILQQADLQKDISQWGSILVVGAGVLLAVSGLIAGLIGLLAVPKHGAKGLLLPSLAGVLLSAGYLYLLVFTFMAVRQLAKQRGAVSHESKSIERDSQSQRRATGSGGARKLIDRIG
jgi:hypothetical protein